MHPLEVLNKLRQLKTPKARRTLLGPLSKNHEFWFGAAKALNIQHVCLPPLAGVVGAITDVTHGSGVPAGIFEKSVLAIEAGKIKNGNIGKALRMFASKCTKEDWEEWYKPILLGDLFIPISLDEFCSIAPATHRFFASKELTLSCFQTRYLEDNRIGGIYAVEPFIPAQRVILFIGMKVAAFTTEGLRIDHPHLNALKSLYSRTQMPLALDVYLESEEIILVRDLLTHGEIALHESQINTEDRYLIADQIVRLMNRSGILGAELIERHFASQANIRQNTQMFLEQGYQGVVFDNAESSVLSPIIAHPTRESIFTCMDIIDGEDEYRGKAEYILGRGMIDKERVQTNIFYGLNWEQRDLYFKDRDQLIGKRFEVVSCGLDSDKRVVMPVFKKWRE